MIILLCGSSVNRSIYNISATYSSGKVDLRITKASSTSACSRDASTCLSFSTVMADLTQTDVSRPSALPTARFRSKASQIQALAEQNSTEYLDAVEEDWNKKIDTEVETLVDGMVDIVNLASASDSFRSMSWRN